MARKLFESRLSRQEGALGCFSSFFAVKLLQYNDELISQIQEQPIAFSARSSFQEGLSLNFLTSLFFELYSESNMLVLNALVCIPFSAKLLLMKVSALIELTLIGC